MAQIVRIKQNQISSMRIIELVELEAAIEYRDRKLLGWEEMIGRFVGPWGDDSGSGKQKSQRILLILIRFKGSTGRPVMGCVVRIG